ncbi:MAG: hypothetical protein Q3997_04040, partial [Propionibacteriaceae bacterium]|nr:hypothetical protein [Propionibacteriaceae bacterium]
PYGQQPSQPCGQSPYAQPYDYGQQQAQPYGYGALPAVAEKKPAMLGIIAFAVVVLGSLLFGWPFQSLNLPAIANNTNAANDPSLDAASTIIMLGGGLVFAGFVTSIIAIVMARGRVWGIVGLILSFILPWIFAFTFMFLNPTMEAALQR